jgi:hypothetical protein
MCYTGARNIWYANQDINAVIKDLSWKLERKVEKHEVQVGRPKNRLVDSPTNLQHGHSLLVCGHVQNGEGFLPINTQKNTCLMHGS